MTLVTITESNLSIGWAKAYLALETNGELSPFVLHLTDLDQGGHFEDADLRDALDCVLDDNEQQSVETVANTIFPQSLWRRAKGDRKKLFAMYREYLPDYVSMERRKNNKGLYFARLIAFGLDPDTGKQVDHLPESELKEGGNQLEFIITRCQKGALRAKFQATLYDPMRDQHDGPYQRFPCLQHVTFVPDFKSSTLSMNAFYATQQLFVKGYGNWLGLLRLGAFVADQAGLDLSRFTCIAGIEKMDTKKPRSGDQLDRLRDRVIYLAESATPTTA